MSLQLTLANAEHRAADERWRDHKLGCPPCSQAQHTRKPEGMCRTGTALYADFKARERDLVRERKLERQPMPGQDALFETEAAAPVMRRDGA